MSGVPTSGRGASRPQRNREVLFEEVIVENFCNLVKEIDKQSRKLREYQKEDPKETHTKTRHN